MPPYSVYHLLHFSPWPLPISTSPPSKKNINMSNRISELTKIEILFYNIRTKFQIQLDHAGIFATQKVVAFEEE